MQDNVNIYWNITIFMLLRPPAWLLCRITTRVCHDHAQDTMWATNEPVSHRLPHPPCWQPANVLSPFNLGWFVNTSIRDVLDISYQLTLKLPLRRKLLVAFHRLQCWNPAQGFSGQSRDGRLLYCCALGRKVVVMDIGATYPPVCFWLCNLQHVFANFGVACE